MKTRITNNVYARYKRRRKSRRLQVFTCFEVHGYLDEVLMILVLTVIGCSLYWGCLERRSEERKYEECEGKKNTLKMMGCKMG